jgi:ATP-dependent protease Clp ATPase subunit
VIGQEEAKKIYRLRFNHYKRLNQRTDDDVELKSNIVIVNRQAAHDSAFSERAVCDC